MPQSVAWGGGCGPPKPADTGLSTTNDIVHKSRRAIQEDEDGKSQGLRQVYDTHLTGTRKPNNGNDKIEVGLWR